MYRKKSLCMCIHTLNPSKATSVPSQNGYIGSREYEDEWKYKQGKKITPTQHEQLDQGSFSLEKGWLKKDVTGVFKICSIVSSSGLPGRRKLQAY